MGKNNETVIQNILEQYKRKDGTVSSFYLKRAINKGYNQFVLNENYSLSALQRKVQTIYEIGSKDINNLSGYEAIFFVTMEVWGLKKEDLTFNKILKFKPELQTMKDGTKRNKWSLKMFLDSLDLYRISVSGLSEYEKIVNETKDTNAKVKIEEKKKPAAKKEKKAA
jgi:hypothetical protein